MEYLKNLIIILCLILISSCAGDPCETVNCVNGNCVDGTCQCEEGYVGELCNELPCVNGASVNGSCNCEEGYYGKLCDIDNIVGFYWITKLKITGCPNYVKQYDLSSSFDDKGSCGTNGSNRPICFAYNLSLRDNNTMFRVESITVENDKGEKELTYFDFKQGIYTTSNEMVSATLDNGDKMELRIEQGKLIDTQKYPGDGTDCQWLIEYTLDPG